jgi:hypothetical protein
MEDQNSDNDITMANTHLTFSEISAHLAKADTDSSIITKIMNIICQTTLMVTDQKYRYEKKEPHPFQPGSINSALRRMITETSNDAARMTCAYNKHRQDIATLAQHLSAGTLPVSMERERKLLPENLSPETLRELSAKMIIERAKPLCRKATQLKLTFMEQTLPKVQETILVTLPEPLDPVSMLLKEEATNSLDFFTCGEIYHQLLTKTNAKVAEFNLKALKDRQKKAAKKVEKQLKFAKIQEAQEEPLTWKSLKKVLPKLVHRHGKKDKEVKSKSSSKQKQNSVNQQGKAKPESLTKKRKIPALKIDTKAKPTKKRGRTDGEKINNKRA